MTDSERYRKLRRWMTSNVTEGWTEVERLAAIGCYLSWEDFDGYLDDLPECNFGLVANCPPDNQIMANGLTQAETEATPSCAGLTTGLTVKPRLKWFGGDCPVSPNDMVKVEFNGGKHIGHASDYDWSWHDDGHESSGDIVAYRVL